jgi:hypothetical protein
MARRPDAARRGFDVLAPPVLYGGMFLYLFGLAVVDCYTVAGAGEERLRHLYFAWRGVDVGALAYVWTGFFLFGIGYYAPLGRVVGRALAVRPVLHAGRA